MNTYNDVDKLLHYKRIASPPCYRVICVFGLADVTVLANGDPNKQIKSLEKGGGRRRQTQCSQIKKSNILLLLSVLLFSLLSLLNH